MRFEKGYCNCRPEVKLESPIWGRHKAKRGKNIRAFCSTPNISGICGVAAPLTPPRAPPRRDAALTRFRRARGELLARRGCTEPIAQFFLTRARIGELAAQIVRRYQISVRQKIADVRTKRNRRTAQNRFEQIMSATLN